MNGQSLIPQTPQIYVFNLTLSVRQLNTDHFLFKYDNLCVIYRSARQHVAIREISHVSRVIIIVTINTKTGQDKRVMSSLNRDSIISVLSLFCQLERISNVDRWMTNFYLGFLPPSTSPDFSRNLLDLYNMDLSPFLLRFNIKSRIM